MTVSGVFIEYIAIKNIVNAISSYNRKQRLSSCNEFLFAVGNGKQLAGGEDLGFAGFDDAGAGDEVVAYGWA